MSSSILILWLATLGTSFISGLTGLAGGAILIGILSLFYEPALALALHALFQTVSNAVRIKLHWKNVNKPLVLKFVILVIPGVLLARTLIGVIPTPYLRIGLALGLLLSLFFKKRSLSPTSLNWYIPIGGLAGFFGTLVGAVGPLLASFLMRPGMPHSEFVGTKSACQLVVQLTKSLVLFSFITQANLHTQWWFYPAFIGIFVGNIWAKKVGDKLPQLIFERLVWWSLLILSCWLLIKSFKQLGFLVF